MKSAVRWYERAIAGKLAEHAKDLALERCVLRADRQSRRSTALPAGLSAVLRDRQVSGSGVPVRLGMMMAVADDEQRPWIDAALPRSIAAAGIGDPIVAAGIGGPGERSVFSKALMKPAAVDERNIVSSRPGIATGRKKASVDAGGQGSSTPAEALAVVQRITSRPTVSDTASVDSLATDPAPADPLAAVLFGGGKPSSAYEKAQDARGPGTMVADANPGSSMFAEAVAHTRTEASDISRMAAVSTLSGRDNPDGAGLVPQAAAAASRSRPDLVRLGNDGVPAADFGRPIDRVVNGALDGPPAAADLVLAGIGQGTGDSRFRDPAMEGQDIVPRRAVTPVQGNTRMKPQGVVRRTEAGAIADHVGTPDNGRPAADSSTGPGTAPAAQPGTTVNLRGDMMMDGRKMGRLVATGQTSAASLPTVSGSAINLRVLPIFSGTGAAL